MKIDGIGIFHVRMPLTKTRLRVFEQGFQGAETWTGRLGAAFHRTHGHKANQPDLGHGRKVFQSV